MPFIDFTTAPHQKVWDGIHGPIFHSDQVTFAQLTLEEGAIVKEHSHHQEQWTYILEGRMQFTLGDETKILTAGMAAHMPSHIIHSAVALTRVRVIDCFVPVREDFRTLPAWE